MSFACLESNKRWKRFPFLCKTTAMFKKWNIFLSKTIISWRRVQSETIFETQKESTNFKEMLFTEIKKANIGHLHSLFSCFWGYSFLWEINESFSQPQKTGISFSGHMFFMARISESVPYNFAEQPSNLTVRLQKLLPRGPTS